MDPGFLGLDALIGFSRHLGIGPPVDQIDIFGIEFDSRFNAIHGHRTAADDRHRFALDLIFDVFKAPITQRRQIVYRRKQTFNILPCRFDRGRIP